MLTNVNKNIFLNSDEINLLPVVSAEWNQNLFNPPYITVAGTGVKETVSPSGTYTAVTDSNKHPNFITKSFNLSNNAGNISYTCTTNSPSASSYKIVTYVKTNNSTPIMLHAYAKDNDGLRFGSTHSEINSYGWTKIELIMGGQYWDDAISNITFTVACNTLSSYPLSATVYFTVPEIYQNEHFNYQYNSLWPTDSPFAYFRPGESYVSTGNSNIPLPSEFRKVNSGAKRGFTGDLYAPVSSIIENPGHLFITPYNPFIKNVLPTDIAAYKYFVSEPIENSSISAIYANPIGTNKIVVKFNTMITTPNIALYLNGSQSPVYSGEVPSNGVLILYYGGSSWSTTKWTSQPKFTDSGTVDKYMTINKITLTQVDAPINSVFSGKTGNTDFDDDSLRMHLIELSPRLEIDVTDYVQDVSINKQLDSKSTVVPLSTINTDDASLTLTGLPIFTGSDPIPLFSNQSNSSSSVLANMLRKNVKLYISWNLLSYSTLGSTTEVNSYIPAGVFYTDSWDESDIDTIKIQAYDIIRYLQTLPVPDYVANYKTVYDIITMLLDRAGFTDYDIDSLYTVTNDRSSPMDMSYYYANSQDKTVSAALSELFLAYQIGAYIDEYGVMKFLSLANILKSSLSDASISLTDSHVNDGGYSVSNIGKIGKISLRYQEPKIKQSLALQNATDPTQRNSPSFIYTTSNDQVWISNNLDSVGFNHLASDMGVNQNKFAYNINDLLDQFHTFNLNNNGYAAIEDEIVSFEYKEYNIQTDSYGPVKVSVKNDIELASEVDRFVKGNVTPALAITDGSSNVPPTNITVGPSGYITNVKRGLFGTSPKDHTIITTLDSKSLNEAQLNTGSSSSVSLNSNNTAVVDWNPYTAQGTSDNKSIKVIGCSVPVGKRILVYPDKNNDGYSTFSAKFNIAYNDLFAGGVFFGWDGSTSFEGSYMVELVKHHSSNTSKTEFNLETGSPTTTTTKNYQYLMTISQMKSDGPEVLYWADVTATVSAIMSNFPKVLINNPTGNQDLKFGPAVDDALNLRVATYIVAEADGETDSTAFDVFINNSRIIGWMERDTNISSNPNEWQNAWAPMGKNTVTSTRKIPTIFIDYNVGIPAKFGAYISTSPTPIPVIKWDPATNSAYDDFVQLNMGNVVNTTQVAGSIREIYATRAELKDRNTSYWHQTQQFLNGLIQNQNIYNLYPSYMMQTHPEIVGINVYDVQYQTPAATNVDILPIQYYYKYYPNGNAVDNKYVNELTVDEYSLSYSVPLNTGFRSKFAIANNSPYMVWIHKTPDQLNTGSTQLVLWTHEIVAQSDPRIVERVLNINNATEVAQLDTMWIQSAAAADKMISLVANSIDGFSVDTSLRIFGNPLIQVGDIVSLTYKLTGINQRLFVVQAVKHSFTNGLETTLMLNAVGSGVQY
jgi:hypothetical protein